MVQQLARGSGNRYITGSGDLNVGTGSITISMLSGSSSYSQSLSPSGDMSANTITVNASNNANPRKYNLKWYVNSF